MLPYLDISIGILLSFIQKLTCDTDEIYLSASKLIVYQGDIARLTCSYKKAENFRWMLNNLGIQDSRLKNFEVLLKNHKSVISFTAEGHLNQSKISCIASSSFGELEVSPSATIIIQGLLEPVKSLMWSVTIDMSQLNISWEQPFTLDVPGYDPDIRDYCVYITTLVAPSIVIESNCTEQRYLLYRPPLSLRCHTLNISVIGRNFVGNSHQASVMYNTCYREAACDKEITAQTCSYRLNPPQNGYISHHSEPALVGTIVTVWCKPKFFLKPETAFYTCRNDSWWHPTPLQECVEMPGCTDVNDTTYVKATELTDVTLNAQLYLDFLLVIVAAAFGAMSASCVMYAAIFFLRWITKTLKFTKSSHGTTKVQTSRSAILNRRRNYLRHGNITEVSRPESNHSIVISNNRFQVRTEKHNNKEYSVEKDNVILKNLKDPQQRRSNILPGRFKNHALQLQKVDNDESCQNKLQQNLDHLRFLDYGRTEPKVLSQYQSNNTDTTFDTAATTQL